MWSAWLSLAWDWTKKVGSSVWGDWPTYLYWSAGIPAGLGVMNVVEADLAAAFKWFVAAFAIVGVRQVAIDGIEFVISKLMSIK